MKSHKRLILLVAALIGLVGLLLMASFGIYNACAFANKDSVFIKDQTQLALNTNSLDVAKYHASKALKSLQKTKDNLNDCGCEPALRTALKAEDNLKKAASSKSLERSKEYLKLALGQTLVTIDELRNFESAYSSEYGEDVLVMNTKEVVDEQGGIIMTPGKQLQHKIDENLSEFENSLDAVVKHVDCTDAFNFINKILTKSDRHLQATTTTEAQRTYHTGIKKIAYDALLQLEGCPTK